MALIVDAFFRGLWLVFGYLADVCFAIARETEQVFIIGEWLFSWFWALGTHFDDLAIEISLARDDILGFVADLEDMLGLVEDFFDVADVLCALEDFFANPAEWVAEWLGEAFPWLASLFSDPAEFLVDLLDRLWPDLVQLFDGPVTWLESAIAALFPWLSELLADPPQFIMDAIDRLIESEVERIGSWAQSVTTKLLQFLW